MTVQPFLARQNEKLSLALSFDGKVNQIETADRTSTFQRTVDQRILISN